MTPFNIWILELQNKFYPSELKQILIDIVQEILACVADMFHLF